MPPQASLTDICSLPDFPFPGISAKAVLASNICDACPYCIGSRSRSCTAPLVVFEPLAASEN